MTPVRLVPACALIALSAGLLTACGYDRSPEAFCTELDNGEAAMEANYDAASDDVGGQLGVALQNMGEYSRMIGRLAEAAPDEIRSDMDAAAKAWGEQADTAKEAASDPLGTIAGAIVTGVLSSASYAAVDEYAQEHCGQPVFGLAGSVAGADAEPEDVASEDRPAPAPSTSSPGPSVLTPGENWAVFGHVLRASGFNDDPDRINGSATLYTPAVGEIVVDATSLFPGEEVTNQTWVITGPDSSHYLAGLVTIREPADGLDPEAWVTSVVAVDLTTAPGTLLGATDVLRSACDSAVDAFTLAASFGDAVSFTTGLNGGNAGCSLPTVTAEGRNPKTGAQLWSRQVSGWDGSARGSILVDDVGEGTDDDGNPCATITGIEVATGRDLFEYRSIDHPTNGRCDQIEAVDYVGDAAVYTARAQHSAVWTLHSNYGTESDQRSFSVVDGRELTVKQPFQLYDPVTGRAGTYGQDFGSGKDTGLEIYDPESGQTVFNIDVDRFADLNAHVRSLVNGYLYLSTGDQDLQIDVATGDVVSKTASVYPLGVVGAFTYMSDGTLTSTEDGTTE